MKINNETLKFIGKQLPWVIGLLPEDAGTFKVEIVDLDLLSLRPLCEWSSSGSAHWHNYDSILLLDGSGNVVGKVGEETVPFRDFDFTWKFPFIKTFDTTRKKAFPESVEQALERIDVQVDNVRYIMHIGKSDPMPDIVVHILPKKVTSLRNWIGQKADESASELKSQIAEANGVSKISTIQEVVRLTLDTGLANDDRGVMPEVLAYLRQNPDQILEFGLQIQDAYRVDDRRTPIAKLVLALKSALK